jgi:NADH dehydrogenase
LLPQMPEALSLSARRQLERFCVEVRVQTKVADIRRGEVRLEGGQTLAAENIIWAAGVAAHPLSARLDAERDRAGRVKVGPDLSLPRHPEVFVIGDLATVLDAAGKPVPGISPAAMQMARHVAGILRRELDTPASIPSARPAFRYWDKGTMATIGRSAAVARLGRLEFGGFLAWLAWLFVHLVFLIGFDNKLTVLVQWAHSYFTYKRGARIIIRGEEAPSRNAGGRLAGPQPTPPRPAEGGTVSGRRTARLPSEAGGGGVVYSAAVALRCQSRASCRFRGSDAWS